MLRGLYTAGTAMLAQNRRMDVITNNLTNTETVGYKGDTLTTRSFRDMIISRINDPSVYQYESVGTHNTGIHIDNIKTHYNQGALESTDVPTDFALEGDAFFVVETTPRTKIPATPEEKADPYFEQEYEEGDVEYRYTRAGNFDVDRDGYLVTPAGLYVQGEGGRVYVGTTEFQCNERGEISVDGSFVDRLQTVKFEDNSVLRKQGGNVYKIQEGLTDENGELLEIEPENVTNITVKQGFLEASNVDVARETVLMMETYRAFEINQRFVKIFDESLGRAVNDIAKA